MKNEAPKIVFAAAKKSEADRLVKKHFLPELCVRAAAWDKAAGLDADCLVILADEKGKVPMQLLGGADPLGSHPPVIVVSPLNDVEQAVGCMKAGVSDVLVWPVSGAKLKRALEQACRTHAMTQRVFMMESRIEKQGRLEGLIGSSPAMQEVFQTIRATADTPSTILITGESGTGKELAAKALHQLSRRSGRHFVDINCGAIPHELLENELFGHERGAYTGADRRYTGCCERSDGGTLFLDEISEMDLSLQVKVLRFLQERHFVRVGGNEPIPVDVRIVTATNKDLQKEIARGAFREDLFYRLNVVPIAIPPLRERREDIPLLAKYFLEKCAHRNEKPFLAFTEGAMEALMEYHWPGNVRELENTIERAVVLHHDTKIRRAHLPSALFHIPAGEGRLPRQTASKKIQPLHTLERLAIVAALRECTGNVAQTAKQLKIGQATLYRKLKQYGIRV